MRLMMRQRQGPTDRQWSVLTRTRLVITHITPEPRVTTAEARLLGIPAVHTQTQIQQVNSGKVQT